MEEKRSWWQKIKQHRVVTGVVVLLVLILFILLAYNFGWDWTGFNSSTNQITITSTSKGNYIATVSQSSKSLWDWLNFFFIGMVTLLAAILTNLYSNRQNETELAIASEKQRKDDLQAYIDKISEPLLEKHLRESKPDEEVRKIARVRTMTVLHGLDPIRKGSVLQFLYESGLISGDKDKVVIHLQEADLNGANLTSVER